jgi:sortase B
MKKSKVWLTAAVVLAAAAVAFTIKYTSYSKDDVQTPSASSYIVASDADSAGIPSAGTSIGTGTYTADGKYISPIDFDKLKEDNADTLAWVEIPNSDMSFPVMQRADDNSYYLSHDFNNAKSIYGAAYIEDYNQSDFSDTAVVIYGHNINNGEWFGELQTIFTDSASFENSRDIKLYLPNEERTYRVFAAVPYDDSHILYYNDFTNDKVYDDFIKNIAETRAVNSIVDSDSLPTAGTPLLIFSTCMSGDYSRRFLVIAALSGDS